MNNNLKKIEELGSRLDLLESARLAELNSIKLLDTLHENLYDNITEVLSRVLDVPIALVSIVDDNRQWFKSRVGLEVSETAREISFCTHIVESGQIKEMVVENALADKRFCDNPLVTSDPNIRFYAGYPIISNGYILGTLCAIDRKPRALTADELVILRLLTRQVEIGIQIRKRMLGVLDFINL